MAGTGPGDTAKDEKGLQDGTYQSTALMAAVQSPPTSDPPILLAGQTGLLTNFPPDSSVKVNGGHVSVRYNAALNPPADQAFSVEAWVHPEWSTDETDLFRCVVASREDTGTNKHGYIIYAGPVLDPTTFATTDPAMHWQAWVGDGTTWLMLVGPPVEVGQNTYLLLTYDGRDPDKPLTLDAISAVTNMSTYERVVRFDTVYSPNPAEAARPVYIGMGAPETPGPPEVSVPWPAPGGRVLRHGADANPGRRPRGVGPRRVDDGGGRMMDGLLILPAALGGGGPRVLSLHRLLPDLADRPTGRSSTDSGRTR